MKSLLDKIFYRHGRVRPHERILCWFPKYYEFYNKTLDSLIWGNEGSLDLVTKLYLGIMAVSCFNCQYLLNILQEQFVLNGGNVEWIIIGLKAVDARIAKFAEINEILAYRPWKLGYKHIQSLLTKDEDGLSWSFQQILTACSVMSHYHSLSCLVLG